MLKNYDPQRDKRFSGTVRLPHIPRPRMKICVLGDQRHCDQANANGIPCMDVEALKKLNKNKKLVKKLAGEYDNFLASASLIKVSSGDFFFGGGGGSLCLLPPPSSSSHAALTRCACLCHNSKSRVSLARV